MTNYNRFDNEAFNTINTLVSAKTVSGLATSSIYDVCEEVIGLSVNTGLTISQLEERWNYNVWAYIQLGYNREPRNAEELQALYNELVEKGLEPYDWFSGGTEDGAAENESEWTDEDIEW